MALPFPRAIRPVVRFAATLGLLLPLAGCVELGSFLRSSSEADAAPASQLVATWWPEVVTTPDPTHGGIPTPGLAGRVYLFGQDVKCPLTGDGCCVVDLFDETPGHHPQGPNPAPLEEWRIDRDTMKRLQRRDAVGMGYTLFLPWGTYRADITHVRLRLRFEPGKGSPLFSDSAVIVLRKNTFSGWQNTEIPALQTTEQEKGKAASQTAAKLPTSLTPAKAALEPVLH